VDVGVYCRLSEAKDSEEATELAVDRQEERCRALAVAKGWQVVQVYEDVDRSAYRREGKLEPPPRPAFEAMLEDLESGRIGGLLFYKLDRLVRDHGDFEKVLRLCEARRTPMACVVDAIDTTTPTGEAMARTMVTFARLESQTIGRRVRDQREQQARRGLPSPGKRCYGYSTDGMTVVEDEARWLKEAAGRLLDGERLGAIVKDMTERGCRTTGGKPWLPNNFKTALLRPRVAGLRDYKGSVLADGCWPAILDRVDQEQLRLLFRKGMPSGRVYLLPRVLLRCGHCGAGMSGRPRYDGAPRYGCWRGPGLPGCGSVMAVCHGVDELVTDAVLTALDSPALDQALAEQEQAHDETRALLDQIALDEEMLKQLAIDLSARLMTRAEWQAAREATTRRIEQARSRLHRSNRMLASLPSGREALDRWWAAATDDQRRTLLCTVLDQVVIRPSFGNGSRFRSERAELRWRV
jgi:site-specific DNA recombinase